MIIEIDGGGKVAFDVPSLRWVDSTGDGSIMQICRIAGQKMMAITDDAGGFDLLYLNFKTGGFATMEAAKQAAPEFARRVLRQMIEMVTE